MVKIAAEERKDVTKKKDKDSERRAEKTKKADKDPERRTDVRKKADKDPERRADVRKKADKDPERRADVSLQNVLVTVFSILGREQNGKRSTKMLQLERNGLVKRSYYEMFARSCYVVGVRNHNKDLRSCGNFSFVPKNCQNINEIIITSTF